MEIKLAAILVFILAAASVQAQTMSWLDVSLDEEGVVTEATAVGEIHPALVEPIRNWVKGKTFRLAGADDLAASSTTSVWVSYALAEIDGGDYELQFLDHGNGPRPVKQSKPDYPRSALLNGEEGWVRLGFRVQPGGEVSDIEVLESSQRVFEKPALRAMKKWRFQPDTVEGKPVSTPMVQTIEFKLE
jgi:TonB family protein